MKNKLSVAEYISNLNENGIYIDPNLKILKHFLKSIDPVFILGVQTSHFSESLSIWNTYDVQLDQKLVKSFLNGLGNVFYEVQESKTIENETGVVTKAKEKINDFLKNDCNLIHFIELIDNQLESLKMLNMNSVPPGKDLNVTFDELWKGLEFSHLTTKNEAYEIADDNSTKIPVRLSHDHVSQWMRNAIDIVQISNANKVAKRQNLDSFHFKMCSFLSSISDVKIVANMTEKNYQIINFVRKMKYP